MKKTILVKDKSESNVLVLNTERDDVHDFSGDVARLMMIIYRHSLNNQSLTFEFLMNTLVGQSESFQKNEHKEECIKEAIRYFNEQGFIEISE